jgi:hypothetical protein
MISDGPRDDKRKYTEKQQIQNEKQQITAKQQIMATPC